MRKCAKACRRPVSRFWRWRLWSIMPWRFCLVVLACRSPLLSVFSCFHAPRFRRQKCCCVSYTAALSSNPPIPLLPPLALLLTPSFLLPACFRFSFCLCCFRSAYCRSLANGSDAPGEFRAAPLANFTKNSTYCAPVWYSSNSA